MGGGIDCTGTEEYVDRKNDTIIAPELIMSQSKLYSE